MNPTPEHTTESPRQRTVAATPALEVPIRATASVYPEPYASRMHGRVKRALGDHYGLRNFAVNLTALAPGAQSALRHAHSRQDEFIYVVSGHPSLMLDDREQRMSPGDCVGFAAGSGASHQLINKSAEPVLYLEVGDRGSDDEVSYPYDNLKATRVADQWVFTTKAGVPLPSGR